MLPQTLALPACRPLQCGRQVEAYVGMQPSAVVLTVDGDDVAVDDGNALRGSERRARGVDKGGAHLPAAAQGQAEQRVHLVWPFVAGRRAALSQGGKVAAGMGVGVAHPASEAASGALCHEAHAAICATAVQQGGERVVSLVQVVEHAAVIFQLVEEAVIEGVGRQA